VTEETNVQYALRDAKDKYNFALEEVANVKQDLVRAEDWVQRKAERVSYWQRIADLESNA